MRVECMGYVSEISDDFFTLLVAYDMYDQETWEVPRETMATTIRNISVDELELNTILKIILDTDSHELVFDPYHGKWTEDEIQEIKNKAMEIHESLKDVDDEKS